MNVAVCLKRVFISSIHRMMRARAFIQRHPFHMATSFKAHTHSYKYLQLGFIHGPREAPALNLSLSPNQFAWLAVVLRFFSSAFFSCSLIFLYHISYFVCFAHRIASHRGLPFQRTHIQQSSRLCSAHPLFPASNRISRRCSLALSLFLVFTVVPHILHESEVNKLHKTPQRLLCVPHVLGWLSQFSRNIFISRSQTRLDIICTNFYWYIDGLLGVRIGSA